MPQTQLISTPEELTPEWVTETLRSTDTIEPGTKVGSVTTKSMADEGGLLSEIYRVSVTYEGGDGPSTMIVKLPINDPAQRGMADALGFYAREVNFFREIAETAPFDCPRLYGWAKSDDASDFVLVIEDLAGLRQLDQKAGVSLDDARTVLSSMAALHAQWWEDERIPEMSARYLPIKNPVYLAALPGVFEHGWANAQEHGAGHLTPELIAFGNRYQDLLPWLLDTMSGPTTLVHGDWRADNVFVGSPKGVAMIDFQITSFATGLYDVGYFLGQSLADDVLAGNDEALIHHYLSELAANGVEYPFEEAWYHYRVVLAFCLIYAVASFQSWEHFNEQQHELMRTMLRRSAQGILRTDALSLLPQT